MEKPHFEESFAEGFGTEVAAPPSAIEQAELQSQEIIMGYNRQTFQDILQSNGDRPVRVLGVNVIRGSENYRENFLKSQLNPLLCSQDTDLGTFLKNIDLSTQNFYKTNSIKNILCSLEMAPYKMTNTSPDTLELVANLQLDPVKKFFMKIGTNVGNGEGDGYIQFQWKNIFGGGEMINLDTTLASNEIGKSNRSQYICSFSTPLNNSPNWKFDTIGYHSSKFVDYTTYHEQLIKGLTLKLTTTHMQNENKFNHEFSFENLIRGIHISQPFNSYRNNSVVNDYFLLNAGSELKSSLTHTMTFDSRDSLTMPTRGHIIKHSLELGIAPNAQFVKSHLDLAKSFNLDPVILSFSAKAGVIKSFGGCRVHPMDKFQLGGANDVRGFLVSGLGPKDMGLPIGGDFFYSFNTSIVTRLPFLSMDSGFKGHFFTNGGKLINLDQNSNDGILKGAYSSTGVSLATGVGLVYAHPMARFELNWVVPLAINQGDHFKQGLQWGIGMSFM